MQLARVTCKAIYGSAKVVWFVQLCRAPSVYSVIQSKQQPILWLQRWVCNQLSTIRSCWSGCIDAVPNLYFFIRLPTLCWVPWGYRKASSSLNRVYLFLAELTIQTYQRPKGSPPLMDNGLQDLLCRIYQTLIAIALFRWTELHDIP